MSVFQSRRASSLIPFLPLSPVVQLRMPLIASASLHACMSLSIFASSLVIRSACTCVCNRCYRIPPWLASSSTLGPTPFLLLLLSLHVALRIAVHAFVCPCLSVRQMSNEEKENVNDGLARDVLLITAQSGWPDSSLWCLPVFHWSVCLPVSLSLCLSDNSSCLFRVVFTILQIRPYRTCTL